MAIDNAPEQQPLPMDYPPHQHYDDKFPVILVLVLLLACGLIYSLMKMSALRKSLEAQQVTTRNELIAQFQSASKPTAFKTRNASGST